MATDPGHLIRLRLHGNLNDFLPTEKKGCEFGYPVAPHASLKDVIEAAGCPHVEIGEVRVDGRIADLIELVKSGTRVEVFPQERPRAEKFLLDVHLKKLAGYLRLLGFDTHWDPALGDPELAELSAREGRVLLTRDIGLLKRGILREGYWMREVMPKRQLQEVLRRFELHGQIRPFARCMRCNSGLRAIPRDSVRGRVELRTWESFESFFECEGCRQVYWEGSHYDRMNEFIETVRRSA